MLSLSNLSIKINDFHLSSPGHIHIKSGEKVLVTGKNGAGKSVLLYAILDLVKNTKGEILILGKPNSSDGWQGKVGAYLDPYFLIPFLSPMEHLVYLGKVKKVQGELMNGLVKEAIERLEFDVSQRKLIRELSAGNRQKLGIISSLLGEPSLLVWDEPSANLDTSAQEGLTFLMESLEEQTIIYAEHLHTSSCSYERRLKVEGGIIKEVIDGNATG